MRLLRSEGGDQLRVQEPLGAQPVQQEPPGLVLLATLLEDSHPVLFAPHAERALHGAVARSRISAELLASLPVLLQRGPELGLAVVPITERGLEVAPLGGILGGINEVRHRGPPSRVGGVRRAFVAGTMQADAVAVAARGLPAWCPPAPAERTAFAAGRPLASEGTNRGRGESRSRSDTWAYRSPATPSGGCRSAASQRRSSAARAGDGGRRAPTVLHLPDLEGEQRAQPSRFPHSDVDPAFAGVACAGGLEAIRRRGLELDPAILPWGVRGTRWGRPGRRGARPRGRRS